MDSKQSRNEIQMVLDRDALVDGLIDGLQKGMGVGEALKAAALIVGVDYEAAAKAVGMTN